MPKYVLKIEAVFEADKPLNQDARRNVVSGLRKMYGVDGVLEYDIQDFSPNFRSSKKPALIISFEPQP